MLSCAPQAGRAVGFSHDGNDQPAQRVDAGPRPVRVLAVLGSVERARMTKVMTASPSQHALGRFDGEVLVDETKSLYLEDHRERATNKPGPTYVMKRAAGGWSFYAQDGSGILLDDETSAETRAACAGCHADAPTDGVFR